MNTCETCKHWKRIEDIKGQGRCYKGFFLNEDAESNSHDPEDTKGIQSFSDEWYHREWFGKDFGCIHWEGEAKLCTYWGYSYLECQILCSVFDGLGFSTIEKDQYALLCSPDSDFAKMQLKIQDRGMRAIAHALVAIKPRQSPYLIDILTEEE